MDKKQMEEPMKKRVARTADQQVVKSVDLLKPVTPGEDRGSVVQEIQATNNQTAEAPNMSIDKAVSIQETKNEDLETGKKRGRPKSTTEGLVHLLTWLPEELAWAIRARAVVLHKKDYEVVTEAIETYLATHTNAAPQR
jgi:hypothetical protein